VGDLGSYAANNTAGGHLPKELKGKEYYPPSNSGYEKTIQERIKGWEERKKK